VQVAVSSVLKIRRQRGSDAAFIRGLAARAFAEYDLDAGSAVSHLTRSGTTWVACRGHEPLGFAVSHRLGRGAADICAIAVAEQARGTGIGRALLRHVERALRNEGIAQLSLHTAQANVAALELFLKHGFKVERRLPRFYRGVFDACSLSKRLTFEQK
jgi:ribosomal protein S18 acetylase RimI-like enzyme